MADAMATLVNNELRNKRECLISTASKLIGNVLRAFQQHGYVGEFEYIDDGRAGKFRVQLLGRINKCGVIRPRYPVKVGEFEKFEKQYLPSRDVGILIVSTPQGVMSQRSAREKRIGGRLLAFVY